MRLIGGARQGNATYWGIAQPRRSAMQECGPDCPMCELDNKLEAHYDRCDECAEGVYCDELQALIEEQQAIYTHEIPDDEEDEIGA